ncbi:MAG: ABC transporter permease [Candidatus Ancillula sp.]|jgi:ABC-2 type transport system permease protein|nr:ABC transporter permease [Candidatus Ancillula sp.]
MRNVMNVISREVCAKVKTKAFILSTILTALLFSGIAFFYTLVGSNPGSVASMVLSGSQRESADAAALAQEQVLSGLGTTLPQFQSDVAAKTAELTAHLGSNGDAEALILVGILVTVLMIAAIVLTGSQIAMGVVEEKSSRVVEILLSTMSSFQLMFGKIIGNVVVGLIQIGAILVAVGAGIMVTGTHWTGIGNIGSPTFLLILLGYFFVGYFSYACLYAAFASTVSRTEEVNQAITPVMIFAMVPYFMTFLPGIMANPVIGAVMKYCPLLSVISMPGQYAQGNVGVVECLISLAISVAFIPVIVKFASSLYGRSVLQTSKVKFFQKG